MQKADGGALKMLLIRLHKFATEAEAKASLGYKEPEEEYCECEDCDCDPCECEED